MQLPAFERGAYVGTEGRGAYGVHGIQGGRRCGARCAQGRKQRRAFRGIVHDGHDRGAHRDALCMGAALALEVAGVAATPVEGLARAAAAIDDGRAAGVLRAIAAFGAVPDGIATRARS